MVRGLSFVVGVAAITLALIAGYAFWRPPVTDTLKAPSPTVSASGVGAASPSASSSVAASASSSASPSASPTPSYTNAKYGYTLVLPDPYRYSDVLSREMPQSEPITQQVFTARTAADENAVKDQRCETACPVWNYVASVMIWTDTGTASPREWYDKFSYARDQTFTDLVVDGRQAMRVDHGASFPAQIVIKDGPRMIVIAYQIYPPYTPEFDPPPGASHDKLERILASFHFR